MFEQNDIGQTYDIPTIDRVPLQSTAANKPTLFFGPEDPKSEPVPLPVRVVFYEPVPGYLVGNDLPID